MPKAGPAVEYYDRLVSVDIYNPGGLDIVESRGSQGNEAHQSSVSVIAENAKDTTSPRQVSIVCEATVPE